jgi:hypothetical protein
MMAAGEKLVDNVQKQRKTLLVLVSVIFCILPVFLFAMLSGLAYPTRPAEQPSPDVSLNWVTQSPNPLPVIVLQAWAFISGDGIITLRWLALILGLVSLLVFELIRFRSCDPSCPTTTFILAFTPFFILLSITGGILGLGLPFLLLFTLLGHQYSERHSWIAFLFMVICYFFLLMINALFIYLFIPALYLTWIKKGSWQQKALATLIALLPTSILLAFTGVRFSLVSSFNHMEWNGISLGISVIGLLFLPIFLSGIRRWGGMWPYGLIGGLFALLFPIGLNSGTPWTLPWGLYQITSSSPFLADLLRFIFGTIGGWVILALWAENRYQRFLQIIMLVTLCMVVFGAAMCFCSLALLFAPVLLLLATNRWVKKWELRLELVWMILWGCLTFYQIAMGY